MTDVIFYDGGCGLCHGFVRFVLARDTAGRYRFAPLGGETFTRELAEEVRVGLPDSVVLRAADGRIVLRSDAVVEVLCGLGGAWRVIGSALDLVPRSIRDWGYRAAARVRRRILRAPASSCPVVPAPLRERFLP